MPAFDAKNREILRQCLHPGETMTSVLPHPDSTGDAALSALGLKASLIGDKGIRQHWTDIRSMRLSM